MKQKLFKFNEVIFNITGHFLKEKARLKKKYLSWYINISSIFFINKLPFLVDFLIKTNEKYQSHNKKNNSSNFY